MLINLLVLLLIPSFSWAAVDCADAGAVAQTFATPASPMTTSYTRPGGSDFLGFVYAGHRQGTTARTVSSIAWGGDTPTASGAQDYNDPIAGRLYQLVAPASGAQTIDVTWSSTPLADGLVVLACTGVNQSTPTHDFATANGNSGTASVTVSNVTASDVVIACVSNDGARTLTGTGSLTVIATDNASPGELNIGCWYQPGAAGGSVSVTLDVADDWVIQAIAVSPTASTETGGDALWFY